MNPHHPPDSAAASTPRCAAVARGYLARRRVAEMRRQRDQALAQRAEHRRSLLDRRLAKVSAASRTVASCLIANAAAKRRERFWLSRAAVAMVRGRARIYLTEAEYAMNALVIFKGACCKEATLG